LESFESKRQEKLRRNEAVKNIRSRRIAKQRIEETDVKKEVKKEVDQIKNAVNKQNKLVKNVVAV
jgi:hypothetical protein